MRAITSATILLVPVWLILHGQARADVITDKELYAYCSETNGAQNLFCAAYVAGFVDGLVRGEASSLTMTKGMVCLPRAIDGTQARIIAQRFMRESPEILHEAAADVLTAAMWRAFPCASKK